MRGRGLRRFLLVRGTTLGGVLALGLVIGPRAIGAVDTSHNPAPAIAGALLVGLALAFVLWKANERSYRRLRNERSRETGSDREDS